MSVSDRSYKYLSKIMHMEDGVPESSTCHSVDSSLYYSDFSKIFISCFFFVRYKLFE